MSVFKTAKLIFSAMRVGGTFPYSFTELAYGESKDAQGIQFKVFSRVSMWTIIIMLTRIYLGYNCLVFAEGWKMDDGETSSSYLSGRLNNTYEGFVTRTLLSSIAIHSIYQSVVPLLTIRQELQLSKLWEEFHMLFAEHIGRVRQSQLMKARFFALFQLSLISAPVLLMIIGNNILIQIKESETVVGFVARLVFLCVRTLSVMLFPQLEDIKYFINCYFIQLYIQEIRNDIHTEIQHTSDAKLSPTQKPNTPKTMPRLSHQHVQKWHALVAAIHTITSLTGRVMGISQILSILHELFIVTLTVYSASILLGEVISQGLNYLFLYFGLTVASFYLLRTFQRCYCSQMICNQENKTLRTITSIHNDHLDAHSKQEIKFFIDCLQNHPCSISLAGYIEIDNNFFLKILGTILTYVIVLIQFKEVYRT